MGENKKTELDKTIVSSETMRLIVEPMTIWLDSGGMDDELTLEILTKCYDMEQIKKGVCAVGPAIQSYVLPLYLRDVRSKPVESIGLFLRSSTHDEIMHRIEDEKTNVLFERWIREQLKDLFSKLSVTQKQFFNGKYEKIVPECSEGVMGSVPGIYLKSAVLYCEKCLNPSKSGYV